jgi:hypothetical protein
MEIVVLLIALVILAVAALEVGVDSRDGSPDPRRSKYPVGLS